MKHLYSALLLALLTAGAVQAQVGIGTTTPDAKAALDIQAADKGLLVPRLTEAARTGLQAPPQGLLVFQTDGAQPGFYYATGSGTTWLWLPDKAGAADNLGNHTATQALKLQGNALTGTGSSIGTTVGVGVTDKGGLNIGQNTGGNNVLLGFQAGHNTTPNPGTGAGVYNTFIGFNSGYTNSTGARNLFVGLASGYTNSNGSENQFVGFNSGNANTTGSQNYFSGYASGQSNTSGSFNYFSGYQAGYRNTTSQFNHFVGFNSGYSNTSGTNNYFSGFSTGQFNTTGSNNHFNGFASGQNNISGANNYFSGYRSGYRNTSGSVNQFVGYESGYNTTTGNNNLFIGYQSGYNNVLGTNNWALGHSAGPTVDGLTNAGAIGNNAQVSQSNSLVLGGTGLNAVKVGIGTAAPGATLEVNGYTKLGSDAPALKVKKFTTTTPAGQGQSVSLPHGLNVAKIISISGVVEVTATAVVPLNYSAQPGALVGVIANQSNLVIVTSAGSSSDVLSKHLRLVVTYEE